MNHLVGRKNVLLAGEARSGGVKGEKSEKIFKGQKRPGSEVKGGMLISPNKNGGETSFRGLKTGVK